MLKSVAVSAWAFTKKTEKTLLLLCVAASAFSVLLLYTLYHNGISGDVTARHYKMQAATAVIGLVTSLVISAVPYRLIAKFWYIHGALTLLLTLLLFTGLGVRANGADDIGWLNLGFTQIQPSEFFKISFIVTFSLHLSKVAGDRNNNRINEIPVLIPLCLHGAFPVLLIALQGDDGTALVFLFIFITEMFMAGLAWYFWLGGAAMLPAAFYVVWNYVMQPHHKKRFLVLFDPAIRQEEILGIYNQQYNGLIAMGSGGLSGRGLTGGSYHYVAFIQTDFIFAYIGMTLGFIGCVATVTLMMLICGKALAISNGSRDSLGRLIGIGVFALLFFHAVINIGMVLSVLPVVGIPLPFISAGGSNMISNFAAVGLLLSVARHKSPALEKRQV